MDIKKETIKQNEELNKTTLNSYLDVLVEYVELNRNMHGIEGKSTSQDRQMLKLLECIRKGKNMNHFLVYDPINNNHPGFTRSENGIPLCNSCKNPPESCFCN